MNYKKHAAVRLFSSPFEAASGKKACNANDGVGSIRLFPIQRFEGEKLDQNVHPK
jgi:hypothetical protein